MNTTKDKIKAAGMEHDYITQTFRDNLCLRK